MPPSGYRSVRRDVNAGDKLTPTVEELKAFTVTYDGATRPDLVSRWLKLMVAVSDAKALDELKRALSASDLELVSSFQQRLVRDESGADKVFAAMLQELCREILTLEGEEIARRVVSIDNALAERQESLVQALLSALSPEGAESVMRAAEEPAKQIRGSYTDLLAIAARYPEYVKEQYVQRCVSFRYLNAPANER
jgi:hypothetical protein